MLLYIANNAIIRIYCSCKTVSAGRFLQDSIHKVLPESPAKKCQ